MFHLKAQTASVVLMTRKRVILGVMDEQHSLLFYFKGIVFADAQLCTVFR